MAKKRKSLVGYFEKSYISEEFNHLKAMALERKDIEDFVIENYKKVHITIEELK